MSNKSNSLFKGKQEDFFEPIIVRYDGLDAENHQVDLADFGKSAQGIAKIMAILADYIVTGNYSKNTRKLSCRVIATTSRENCYSFTTIIKMIDTSPLLVVTVGGLAVALGIGTAKGFGLFLRYMWSFCIKKPINKEDLKKEILKTGDDPNKVKDEIIDKLITTLDKITSDLMSCFKQAVKPIGHSCNTLKFGIEKENNKDYFVALDIEDKRALGREDIEITSEESYRVMINELDMQQFTCKVSLVDDLYTRFDAKITDPQIELPNNGYVIAMAKKSIITVKAKKKIQQEIIKQFVISDIKNKDDKEAENK